LGWGAWYFVFFLHSTRCRFWASQEWSDAHVVEQNKGVGIKRQQNSHIYLTWAINFSEGKDRDYQYPNMAGE
jgi:hypothetical protein